MIKIRLLGWCSLIQLLPKSAFTHSKIQLTTYMSIQYIWTGHGPTVCATLGQWLRETGTPSYSWPATAWVAAETQVRDPVGKELRLLVDHEIIPRFASGLETWTWATSPWAALSIEMTINTSLFREGLNGTFKDVTHVLAHRGAECKSVEKEAKRNCGWRKAPWK